jgi:ribonuclease-3
LEFLGDAVMELIVTEHLYKEYPDKTEGELTNWRAALVNAKMLTRLPRSWNLVISFCFPKGESKRNRQIKSIYSGKHI